MLSTLTVGFMAAPPSARELTLGYTFDQYLGDFGKSYEPHAYSEHRTVFEARLQGIVQHNAAGASYYKGVNSLTDLTDDEFAAMMGGRGTIHARVAGARDAVDLSKPFNRSTSPLAGRLRRSPLAGLPDAVDWRACTPWADSPLCPLASRPVAPVTTSVKNQGSCGSCWAFASTATLESHFSLSTGRSEALAPQHLVSCAPNADDCGGTGGCSGSTADVAYTWLSSVGGLASAYSYGYLSGVGGQTGRCEAARTTPLANLDGIGKPTSNDYNALMEAVATVGPIAVNVYASTWRDYESGIFDGCNYSQSIAINHVVVLEGYGTDETTGLGYWLIRNSWSTRFGEHGYIRLLREPNVSCGTDAKPGSGWDCKPYPPSVEVCGMCGVAYQPTYPTGVRAANITSAAA